MKTNLAQNQRTPPNPSDTKKEESWLSKNAQLLVNIALGAVAIAVIYKLGQSLGTPSPQQPKWQPLTESDQAYNGNFPRQQVIPTIEKDIVEAAFSRKTVLEDIRTLLNFCVNNKMEAYATKDSFKEKVTLSREGCGELAIKAMLHMPLDGSTVDEGFSDYFPDLTKINGEWLKKA